MLVWIFGVITLSAILIFLIHQVYEYLKRSFSKPLERSIVNETKAHYEQIYSTLATSKQPIATYLPEPVNYLPVQEPVTEVYTTQQQQSNMADELMNFVNDLEYEEQEL